MKQKEHKPTTIAESVLRNRRTAFNDLPELYKTLWILVILSMLSGAGITIVVGIIVLLRMFP